MSWVLLGLLPQLLADAQSLPSSPLRAAYVTGEVLCGFCPAPGERWCSENALIIGARCVVQRPHKSC